MIRPLILCFLAGIVGTAGCVERTLSIQSNPPGALVYMNDQEVGRTPLKRRFLWYGYYDVQVRKDGYQSLNTTTPVIAPWWQWVPFDLVAELLPVQLEDNHDLSYHLQPQSQVQVDPEAIVERGQQLREQLESSRLPVPPSTRPTTRHAKK
jgi:hypothetical protein